MILVKIPIGISKVAIPRVISSASKRKLAPRAAERGITFLLSTQAIMRTRWGIMRPIQPIIPATEVAAAVVRVVATITSIFSFRILIPSARASSSPMERIFSLQRRRIKKATPTPMIGIEIAKSFHVARDKLPINQKNKD